MFAVAVWDRDAPPRRADPRPARASSPSTTRSSATWSSSAPSSSASSPAAWSRAELDPEAIAAYLMLGYVPGADDAAEATCASCSPASAWSSRTARARLERWWSYPAPGGRPDAAQRPDEWAEIVLAQARRVRADAPDERRAARRDAQRRPRLEPDRRADGPAHGPSRVETFSVGFAGEDSELPDAAPRRRRARRRPPRARGRAATRPGRPVARSIWHLDEPLADLSSLGFLALCELARRARHGRALGPGRRRAVRRLPQAPRRVAGRDLEPRSRAAARRRGGARCAAGPAAPAGWSTRCRPPDPVARLLASSGLVHADLRAGLFGGALAEHAGAAEPCCAAALAGAPGAAPLEAALYLDAKLGLVDDMLTYFDRASMACSLEVRVPFLDHELVELAARIPTEHKVRRLQGKHVLRAGGQGPRPGLRARQAQARLLQRGGAARGSPRATARSSTGCCSPPTRPTPRCSTRAAVRARRRASGAPGDAAHAHAAAGADDARAVARRVPAARVRHARARPVGGRMTLRYAVVTPARNEEVNLPRLAAALAAQTLPPAAWIVVDDGSTDAHARAAGRARRRARLDPAARRARPPTASERARPRPPRRRATSTASCCGVAPLRDASTWSSRSTPTSTSTPDYFARADRRASPPTSGSASPAAPATSARTASGCGAPRPRRRCGAPRAPTAATASPDSMALEPCMGWDGLDEIRVQLRGMRTQTFVDLPFRHHRPEGGRELSSLHQGEALGRAVLVHGLPPELPRAARGLPRAPRAGRAGDALGLLGAAAQRAPRCPDEALVEALRDRQRLARRYAAAPRPRSQRRS